MIPENLQFGGGVSQTILNPFVLAVVLLAGLVICFAGRKKAIAAFLAAAILIPMDQVLLLGLFHFPMLRLLALFGLIRILWAKFSKREEIFSGGMNAIDKAVILLTIFIAVNGVLLWRESAEVIFQLGDLYTAFGVYFLLRFLIQDEDDVKRAIRVLACVAVVVAAIMIYEQATGHNPLYANLGGSRASEYGTTLVRDSHYRATGPFGHPILAGTFGGIMFPLFLGLGWKQRRDRLYAALGMVSGIVISFAASSSTALFGLIAGIFALCLWPMRRHLRIVRWGIVGTLVAGQLYMTSPVWHIISDIDLTGSSSSYHRYMLVDQCIRHFWSWVLVGTKDYASWGWDMWDLSNQYVAVANPSGLVPLICFLAILVYSFKYLGRSRKAAEGDRKQELFVWAFGASMFANVVAFFGISYFDQTIVVWYAILAMISVVTAGARIAQSMAAANLAAAGPNLGFRAPLAPTAGRGRLPG